MSRNDEIGSPKSSQLVKSIGEKLIFDFSSETYETEACIDLFSTKPTYVNQRITKRTIKTQVTHSIQTHPNDATVFDLPKVKQI